MRVFRGTWLALALAGCGGQSEAERAVAATLGEPATAKFQQVRDRGDFVCGQVNARRGARMSGYIDFVYDTKRRLALVDPMGQAAEASDPADPACRKPLSYQSVDERLNCQWAPERQREAERQRAFDALYDSACR